MANRLYVSGADPRCGKVLVTLGIMDMLERTIGRLGFFRPVGVPFSSGGELLADREAVLVRDTYKLQAELSEMVGIDAETAETRIAAGEQAQVTEEILSAFKRLEEKVDFVLCEGTDFLPGTSMLEADINSDVARDLNAPVALVVNGSSGVADSILSQARIGMDSFLRKGCEVLAVFVNKAPTDALTRLREELSHHSSGAAFGWSE